MVAFKKSDIRLKGFTRSDGVIKHDIICEITINKLLDVSIPERSLVMDH